jgi:hypothetical protein
MKDLFMKASFMKDLLRMKVFGSFDENEALWALRSHYK